MRLTLNLLNNLFVSLLAVLTASCTMFDPGVRDPVEGTKMPADYGWEFPAASSVSNCWWEAFQDPDLSRLVAVALTNNQSLAQAESRLAQARAFARQKGAAIDTFEIAGKDQCFLEQVRSVPGNTLLPRHLGQRFEIGNGNRYFP